MGVSGGAALSALPLHHPNPEKQGSSVTQGRSSHLPAAEPGSYRRVASNPRPLPRPASLLAPGQRGQPAAGQAASSQHEWQCWGLWCLTLCPGISSSWHRQSQEAKGT